jgi:hypothetical protein
MRWGRHYSFFSGEATGRHRHCASAFCKRAGEACAGGACDCLRGANQCGKILSDSAGPVCIEQHATNARYFAPAVESAAMSTTSALAGTASEDCFAAHTAFNQAVGSDCVAAAESAAWTLVGATNKKRENSQRQQSCDEVAPHDRSHGGRESG